MDLTTTYMGLTLKNPIVPSASPLSETLDGIRSMEDAGASAVVMYSLFEEQIAGESQQLDHYLSYGVESFGEALSYFPDLETYKVGPDDYLNLIRQATAWGWPIAVPMRVVDIRQRHWMDVAEQVSLSDFEAAVRHCPETTFLCLNGLGFESSPFVEDESLKLA